MTSRLLQVAVLLLAAAAARCAEPPDTDGWAGLLQCVFQADLANCMERRGVRAIHGLLEQAEHAPPPPEDHRLAEELSEVLSPLLPDMDQEEEVKQAPGAQEGRGKKRKKKKALMKAFMVLMLIKNKLGLLFSSFGALLQIKFFGLAVLNLLFSLFRLYLELVKSKQPQKVIYYEHAQHQHHYEHEHHYDDEHKGGGGSWGSLWGRSIADQQPDDKKDAAQGLAYNSYRPRQISP